MSSVVKRALQKKGNVNIHTKAMAKGVEETETGVKLALKLKVKSNCRSRLRISNCRSSSKHSRNRS